MRQAALYARVSSKDQEREGYSIPAQLKLLREYARTHDFELVHEFLDVETAKTTGRKQFGEMVRFLRENPSCRVAIVEKTDRLYRNFRDCVTLEDLEIEIHLPKEGQVISKDAKSQAKLVHGIQVVIARNYIENLREEVRKGMREKGERTQRIWYYDLSDVKVGKKKPLTLKHFEQFFELLPQRAESERSWSVERQKIEKDGYDLKAVNPHAKREEDTRTPEELLDLIEAKGREIAEALTVLRRRG
ncbi:MAG: recombinase family protein, partial [Candidatus Acidiferrales bacterium]